MSRGALAFAYGVLTNTKLGNEVLKTDVLGRVKTLRVRQETLLDEFERSGVKFAALVGINYQTFATWAQRRRRELGKYPPRTRPRSARPRSTPGPGAAGPCGCSKHSSGGTGGRSAVRAVAGRGAVEVGDAHQAALAAELLRALGTHPC